MPNWDEQRKRIDNKNETTSNKSKLNDGLDLPLVKGDGEKLIAEEADKVVKDIYDKGYNRMKQGIIDTFEDMLEIKPDISARDAYELMKKHELI